MGISAIGNLEILAKQKGCKVNPKLYEYDKLKDNRLADFYTAQKKVKSYEASNKDRKSLNYTTLVEDMQKAEAEYHAAEKLYCSQPGLINLQI